MQDEDIGRVLKAAGLREQPPGHVRDSVYEGLQLEWRALVANERSRRHRRTTFALAAALAVATVATWQIAPQLTTPAATAATVVVASGDVRVRDGWLRGWDRVGVGAVIRSGVSLASSAQGRAAVTLPGGISARIDRDSLLRFLAPDRVVVERGALYVDSGQATPAPLDVVTSSGIVRHVGTQYEVRLVGQEVRIRVREGRIEWRSRRGEVEDGRAGEQLRIDGVGRISRSRAATHGESWQWVAATTPVIDVNGLRLDEFLDWAGRELGCEVVFDDSSIAAEAASIRVRGSIDGLTPAQAVEAVLATTSLRAVVAKGRIAVGRPVSAL